MVAGDTALMLAGQAGQAECVRLLLQAVANPSSKSEDDENAVKMSSNEQALRLLLDAGEDIADISTEMKRTLVGLDDGETISVSKADYKSGCRPRLPRFTTVPNDAHPPPELHDMEDRCRRINWR